MSSLLSACFGIFAKELLSQPSIESIKDKILSNIDNKTNILINRNQKNTISKIFNRYTYISIMILIFSGFGYYYYYNSKKKNKNENFNKISNKINSLFTRIKRF